MSRHGITSADAPALAGVLETHLKPLEFPSLDTWRSEVTRKARPLLGADMVAFQLPHPGLDLLFTEDFDRTQRRDYVSYFMPALIRTKGYARRIEKLGVGNRKTMWASELDWLYGSEYYNEFVLPTRAFDPVWAAVPVRGQKVPAILLAHHGSRRGPHFGSRGLDVMRILRPGLVAAVAAVQALHEHRVSLAGALDRLAQAVMLVEAGPRVLHQNPAATDLFETHTSGALLRNVALSVARGALHPPRSNGRAGDLLAGTGYRVSAIPAHPSDFGPRRAVLVFLEGEAEDSMLRADEVVRRFGLTPRQAEVALLLADRCTSKEIARKLSLSTSTARHHVEAVMLRLGVHSRRDVAERLGIPTQCPERPT